MPKLIMLKGLPASGKSTKAQELMKLYGNFVRVNRDLLRTMLHFDKWNGVNEGLTKKAQLAIVREFLKADQNIIVDDTNLGAGHEASWRGIAAECNATFEIVDCDTNWEECVKRDETREKKVGRHVIIRMAREYGMGGYDMEQDEMICDIDGTLADCSARVAALEAGERKDWDTFFANVINDTPRKEIIWWVNNADIQHCPKRVVLVSGRPERTRKDTEAWLEKYGVKYHVLFMRRDGDRRPDTEVKAEILKHYFNKDRIKIVIDDRPSVIRMWKENGLLVWDVGKGIEF